MAQNAEMLAKVKSANGFIAALDQSGGSTPGALKGYGYQGDEWSSDEEMYDLIHKMRVADHLLAGVQRRQGARRDPVRADDGRRSQWQAGPGISLEQGRRAVPQDRQGSRRRGERGSADEANPDLDALLERGVRKGIFGTKERSVIHLANAQGIADVVAQQFEVGKQVLSHGLVPIIEPEVNIKSAERGAADRDPARRDPAPPRPPAGRQRGHAEAVDSREGGHVRCAGRPSARPAGRRFVRRFLAAPTPAVSSQRTRA